MPRGRHAEHRHIAEPLKSPLWHLRRKLLGMGIDPVTHRPNKDLTSAVVLDNSYFSISSGAGSSSCIQADPAQFRNFSTGSGNTHRPCTLELLENSFSISPGASSSSCIQADPAQFLNFSTGSGNTHRPCTLELLENSFSISSGASSSSCIQADPSQFPNFSTSSGSGSMQHPNYFHLPSTSSASRLQLQPGIVLDESGFFSSSDISALFDDSVSASSGAMRPLVGKLDMLLEGSVSISKRVKDGMRPLKDDVEELSSYLDELSGLEDPPPMAKCWMNEVRDLSN